MFTYEHWFEMFHLTAIKMCLFPQLYIESLIHYSRIEASTGRQVTWEKNCSRDIRRNHT